eukprot:GHVS01087722.1.p1 GENE.GHVS01087722.1~~GHVS01087722.1.p1  ORF type:complete len:226 (+),score=11.85 GHVS01087722.1:63-740(+)
MISFYRSMILRCFLFLILLSFSLTAFASDWTYIIMAVPKGNYATLTLSTSGLKEMIRVGLDNEERTKISGLRNNIHAIIPIIKKQWSNSDRHVVKDFFSHIQPAYDFFAWKGAVKRQTLTAWFGTDLSHVSSGRKSEVIDVSPDNVVFITYGYKFEYLVFSTSKLLKSTLTEPNDAMLEPFANLLYRWIDDDKTTQDPWKTLDVAAKLKVAEAEEAFHKKTVGRC